MATMNGATNMIVFEDLSGSTVQTLEGENPYQGLITDSNNDPKILQQRYEFHRRLRNEQQRNKILDRNFSGWALDQTLHKLEDPERYPNFSDERFCTVFWGRPPRQVRDMVHFVQQELKQLAPTLWLMPLENLHLTVIELAHSLTRPEIDRMVSNIQTSGAADEIVNYTLYHRARLIKPLISYDASAMALSFLPAAGECTPDPDADDYTYHHLRRDIYDKCVAGGVKPASRYSVPSAHLTIARFITQEGWLKEGEEPGSLPEVDYQLVKTLIEKIDTLNTALLKDYWPQRDGTIPAGGDWIVGREKGLDFRKGQVWYGGGQTVILGRGF